jgi:phosphosulfolactate synthase
VFLDLPPRSAKPRDRGLTSVLDRGLSIAEIDGLIEVCGNAVDLVKLGWGTALACGNLDAKLERYRAHDIPVVLGGTVTELALRDDRLEQMVRWVRDDLGLRHVEVSDGSIALEPQRKREVIARLAEEFTVLSEVGSKDAQEIMAPYRWVELIQGELEAGAWKVITEARESGTAGIFRGSGEVRSGLIDEIVHELPVERLLFEAPQKSQQAWFIRQFGPEVNLGNIPPDEVIPLETLRLGLRSDTMSALLLDVKA